MSQKPSKFIYQEIVSKHNERPISCQESGAKTSIFRQRKLLIAKSLIKHPLNAQRAVNFTFNFKLLHRRLPTNCFLKKVGLRDDDKCTFCNKETENLMHLFWRCEKTKNIWYGPFNQIQSCKLYLGEHNSDLHINRALGVRPDRSKHKLQINFCCLIAKHYIWLCGSKERPP